MIVVAIIGILAAVAIPAFVNYMKRAKTTEATENTRMIAEGVVAYWESDHATTDGTGITHCVPTTKGPSPDGNPTANRHPVNNGPFNTHFDEQNGTWPAIGWKPLKPFYYRYTWTRSIADCPMPPQTSENTIGVSSCIGDLDGDGTLSSFSREVKILGGDLSVDNLLKTDELE